MNITSCMIIAAVTLGVSQFTAGAYALEKRGHEKPPESGQSESFQTQVARHSFDIILGRPTDDSIIISLLACVERDIYVVYGMNPETMTLRSQKITLRSHVPSEIVLDDLEPDTDYSFQVLEAGADKAIPPTAEPWKFHTQRGTGSKFSFSVTADSHLDGTTNLKYYKSTLTSAALQEPDFHIDLGDTFMTDKYRDEFRKARLVEVDDEVTVSFMKNIPDATGNIFSKISYSYRIVAH